MHLEVIYLCEMKKEKKKQNQTVHLVREKCMQTEKVEIDREKSIEKERKRYHTHIRTPKYPVPCMPLFCLALRYNIRCTHNSTV